jgi:hypothetical protein
MLQNGNEEKTKVMKILRKPPPLQIMTDHKQLQNVEYFNYLGSMMINNTRHIFEIKSRITIAKAAFNREKNLSPANWS